MLDSSRNRKITLHAVSNKIRHKDDITAQRSIEMKSLQNTNICSTSHVICCQCSTSLIPMPVNRSVPPLSGLPRAFCEVVSSFGSDVILSTGPSPPPQHRWEPTTAFTLSSSSDSFFSSNVLSLYLSVPNIAILLLFLTPPHSAISSEIATSATFRQIHVSRANATIRKKLRHYQM